VRPFQVVRASVSNRYLAMAPVASLQHEPTVVNAAVEICLGSRARARGLYGQAGVPFDARVGS